MADGLRLGIAMNCDALGGSTVAIRWGVHAVNFVVRVQNRSC